MFPSGTAVLLWVIVWVLFGTPEVAIDPWSDFAIFGAALLIAEVLNLAEKLLPYEDS